MNKTRRKQLNEAKNLIDKSTIIIQHVLEEEQDSYDNLSDGLQCTMRGEQMYENISEMEDIIKKIDEINECFEAID